MLNFSKWGAAAMVALLYTLTAQPATAQTTLPELQPCSPQMAATWQNNAFRKALASSQSIQSTHQTVAGDGESTTGPNAGVSGAYQNDNKKNKKNRQSDFNEDGNSCWSKVGDQLADVISGVLSGIAGGFGNIFGLISFPAIGDIDWSDALCSATLRVEGVLAGGIYVAARMPRIITDAMIRRVRWKTRGYRNYAVWEQRRLQSLPERRSKQKVRDWTHSADLPLRGTWGYPSTIWPANWNQGGGG